MLLDKNQIGFEEQKTFEWLKLKKQQFLDFYIPECNIAIECQGEQHFQKSGWGKGNNGEKVIKRDLNKLKLCEEHGIKILYYSKLNINYPYHVFRSEGELIKEIARHLANAQQIDEVYLQ
jgi:very-short-patch-repair endonuclease